MHGRRAHRRSRPAAVDQLGFGMSSLQSGERHKSPTPGEWPCSGCFRRFLQRWALASPGCIREAVAAVGRGRLGRSGGLRGGERPLSLLPLAKARSTAPPQKSTSTNGVLLAVVAAATASMSSRCRAGRAIGLQREAAAPRHTDCSCYASRLTCSAGRPMAERSQPSFSKQSPARHI